MKKEMTGSCDWTATTRENTINLRNWTGAWLVTLALVAFGPKLIWDFNNLLTILAVLINVGVGFGMIVANKRLLKGLDEMQQKIQGDAMALSLGVGLVAGCSYELLEDIRLIAFEPEISHLIVLMALTYGVGIILGNRRYR